MHINYHPITFIPIHGSRNHHEGILRNKIPNASSALWISEACGLDIEFQGLCAGKKQEQAD